MDAPSRGRMQITVGSEREPNGTDAPKSWGMEEFVGTRNIKKKIMSNVTAKTCPLVISSDKS